MRVGYRLRIGQLRQRVTIQQRAVVQDALGQAVETWSDLASNVPADVHMASGQERFSSAADQLVATVTHEVVLRYRDDVTPLHRILYDGRVLDIQSAADLDGRRHALVCLCVERVGEAA